MKHYALVDRYGDEGSRFTDEQWPEIKKRGWELISNNRKNLVQVWRAAPDGELLSYDSAATQRLTNHISRMLAK